MITDPTPTVVPAQPREVTPPETRAQRRARLARKLATFNAWASRRRVELHDAILSAGGVPR